jgi:hypothetical protein
MTATVDLSTAAEGRLGVFVGMWSGAGFGFMMGATFTLARDA